MTRQGTGPSRILALLEEGPHTHRELATACGYEPGTNRAHSFVANAVYRLNQRGYVIENFRRHGSHRGAYYVLVSRPRAALYLLRSERPRCQRCGHALAADHLEDLFCSPCQRVLVDQELSALTPVTLFDAMVAS